MESVNHPSHYGGADNPYEVIKVIEAWDLDFHLGNVVKYIPRAGKKSENSELQDLKKAAFYLNRKIALLEAESVPNKITFSFNGVVVDEKEKCKTCGAQLTYEESAFGWECTKCCQKEYDRSKAPITLEEHKKHQKEIRKTNSDLATAFGMVLSTIDKGFFVNGDLVKDEDGCIFFKKNKDGNWRVREGDLINRIGTMYVIGIDEHRKEAYLPSNNEFGAPDSSPENNT